MRRPWLWDLKARLSTAPGAALVLGARGLLPFSRTLALTITALPCWCANLSIGCVTLLGGHGTAAGVQASFINLDYAEGAELTLCSATIGLLSGVVFGTLFINWGVRAGKLRRSKCGMVYGGGDSHSVFSAGEGEFTGVYPPDDRPSAGLQTVSVDSLDSLALHVVGLAARNPTMYTSPANFSWLFCNL